MTIFYVKIIRRFEWNGDGIILYVSASQSHLYFNPYFVSNIASYTYWSIQI